MGKTLRKTACSPTSALSCCGTVDWRNLSYDVFWMSMRLGTSMTFRTRPRCLRMRKLDWMTLAIAAPDDWAVVGGRARTLLPPRAAENLRRTTDTRDRPRGAALGRDRELSQKFDRVKQKARR